MKIKTENLGTYALLSSVILIIIGVFKNNIPCLIIGGVVLFKIVQDINKIVDSYTHENEVKAYNDGKISDEYINKVSTPIAEKSVNTISNNSKELGITYSKKYELKGTLKNITKTHADLQLYNLIVNKDIEYFIKIATLSYHTH